MEARGIFRSGPHRRPDQGVLRSIQGLRKRERRGGHPADSEQRHTDGTRTVATHAHPAADAPRPPPLMTLPRRSYLNAVSGARRR